mgnify:CR=1 FL=1
MNTKKLEIKDLKFENVFNDFSISVEKEGFIVISGPNNCGKTTLLKYIYNEIKDNKFIKFPVFHTNRCNRKDNPFPIYFLYFFVIT